jgi:hypothetical protein
VGLTAVDPKAEAKSVVAMVRSDLMATGLMPRSQAMVRSVRMAIGLMPVEVKDGRTHLLADLRTEKKDVRILRQADHKLIVVRVVSMDISVFGIMALAGDLRLHTMGRASIVGRRVLRTTDIMGSVDVRRLAIMRGWAIMDRQARAIMAIT